MGTIFGFDIDKFFKDNPEIFEISGILSKGIGEVGGGISASNSAALSANALRQNARIADMAARDAIDSGAIKSQERRVATDQTIGSQRASFAFRNFMVDEGAPLVLAADSIRLGRLDEEEIKKIAEREALGFATEAANFRTRASQAEAVGRAKLVSGIAGGLSALSSAGKVAAKWNALSDGPVNTSSQIGGIEDPGF